MASLFRSVILLILLTDVPSGPQLSIAPPPRPPMDKVETGLVVVDMQINPDGKTSGIEAAQGMTRFVDASLRAARGWLFEPLEKGVPAIPATAVFLFRARTLLPDHPFTVDVPAEASLIDTPPRPMTITDPGYPIQSTAEGVVILQLQIDARGRVHNTNVIRDVPSLTWTATHAVSQ